MLVESFELVYEFNVVLILPLALSKESNLPPALEVKVLRLPVAVCNVPIIVLLLPVYVFNDDIEPVIPSIESTRFFKLRVVVATDEDKLPILELNPNVVVAIDEDKLPILELSPNVVVATDEDKLPMLELNPDVVVATL